MTSYTSTRDRLTVNPFERDPRLEALRARLPQHEEGIDLMVQKSVPERDIEEVVDQSESVPDSAYRELLTEYWNELREKRPKLTKKDLEKLRDLVGQKAEITDDDDRRIQAAKILKEILNSDSVDDVELADALIKLIAAEAEDFSAAVGESGPDDNMTETKTETTPVPDSHSEPKVETIHERDLDIEMDLELEKYFYPLNPQEPSEALKSSRVVNLREAQKDIFNRLIRASYDDNEDMAKAHYFTVKDQINQAFLARYGIIEPEDEVEKELYAQYLALLDKYSFDPLDPKRVWNSLRDGSTLKDLYKQDYRTLFQNDTILSDNDLEELESGIQAEEVAENKADLQRADELSSADSQDDTLENLLNKIQNEMDAREAEESSVLDSKIRKLKLLLDRIQNEKNALEAKEAGEEILAIEELSRAKQDAYVAFIKLPFYARNERKLARDNYRQAVRAYEQKMAESYAAKLADVDGEDRLDYAQQLIEEVNERMQEDANQENQLFIDGAQGRGKEVLKWYGNLSTAKKLGVGAVMATAMAAGGWAVGALAAGGALTGAAASAAGGLLAASRAGRSYATGISRLYKDTPVMTKKFTLSEDQIRNFEDNEQLAKELAHHLRSESKNRVESVMKLRRNVIGISMASVAVGALAGDAIHSLRDTGGLRGMRAVEVFAGAHEEAEASKDVAPSGQDRKVGATKEATQSPGRLTDNTTDTVRTPRVEPVRFNAAEYVRQNVDVTIHAGEGGNSLLHEHFKGVTQAEAVKAWPNIAKGLDAKYPNLIYSKDGEYQLNMPANGVLPKGAAEYIAQSLKDAKLLDEAKDAAVPAHTIKVGEGIISELADRGVNNPEVADINAIGKALVSEGSAYSDGLGSYGLYYDSPGDSTPGGQFTVGAEQIFADYTSDGKLDGKAANLPAIRATDVQKLTSYLGAGDIMRINTAPELQSTLKAVASEIGNLRYADGTPIIQRDPTTSRLSINKVPEGTVVPAKVFQALGSLRSELFGSR